MALRHRERFMGAESGNMETKTNNREEKVSVT
jgi:hypothetical protein